MHAKYEDEQEAEARRIYSDWCSLDPRSQPAFDRLCTDHWNHATWLRGLHSLDQSLRRIASEVGAGSGKLDIDDEPEIDRTVVDDEDEGARVRERLRAVMERTRKRERTIGKYHFRDLHPLWSELGKGGNATVYRALDEDLERTVALKILDDQYVAEESPFSPETKRLAQLRFVDEARLASILDHPNILPVLDFGVTDNGRPYYTMKVVRGETLEEKIAAHHAGSTVWTRERLLHAVLGICDGAAYAHAKGVIHRDLKPKNILVAKNGSALICDWGSMGRIDVTGTETQDPITAPVDREGYPSLQDGVDPLRPGGWQRPVGTASYMPPEQARGDGSIAGRWSDVYSIGAILYYVLAGAPPYLAGPEQPAWSMIVLQLRDDVPPTPLGEVVPGVPRRLRLIVEKAMAMNPAERYRDVRMLAEDLRAYVDARTDRRGRPAPLRSMVGSSASSTLQWAIENRWAAAGAAALVLLAGVWVGRQFGGPSVHAGDGDLRDRLERALEAESDLDVDRRSELVEKWLDDWRLDSR